MQTKELRKQVEKMDRALSMGQAKICPLAFHQLIRVWSFFMHHRLRGKSLSVRGLPFRYFNSLVEKYFQILLD